MDVTVGARTGCMRITLSGALDDTAPEIVRAAAAVASSDGLSLLVDTSAAYPKQSLILDDVRRIVEGFTAGSGLRSTSGSPAW